MERMRRTWPPFIERGTKNGSYTLGGAAASRIANVEPCPMNSANIALARPWFWRAEDLLLVGDLLIPFLRFDALYVNQSDIAERTSQVKRIADIYSKATRVV